MALLRTLDDKIRISIEENETRILGRVPDCDIVLEDGSVSSHHARLHLENHILRVKDLESTNGTRVNYILIDETTLLLDGDTIEFGNVTFTVDAPELCAPSPDQEESKAMTSLEPIESKLEISATMQLSDLEGLEEEEEDKDPLLLRRPKTTEPLDEQEEEGEKEPLLLRRRPTSSASDEPEEEREEDNEILSGPTESGRHSQFITLGIALLLMLIGFGLLSLVVNRISTSF